MNKESITTARAPAAIGPYAQAILKNGTLFVSGQLGIDPATGALERTLEAQTQRAFSNLANLKAVLEAAGTGLPQVLKTTVFLTDLKNFAAVNEIYARYFTPPYPARSCVGVTALPKGVSVEIEAVAAVP